jgi:flavodoxin
MLKNKQKRCSIVVIAIILALTLFTGCGTGTGSSGSASTEESGAGGTGKILIAYFSHTGNTANMANLIQGNVGGDLFEITTIDAYPDDYDTCVAQAKQEKADGYRPALAAEVIDMDSYDIVFIGYPIWISTMPMAVFSFCESYDFSGKTIIPFCSYGGGGAGSSYKDMKALCPDSTFLDGKSIKRNGGDSLPADIEKWLGKIGRI